MELKEILSHAEAVQFLLYSIQHGKQTRTALKKALPKDVPTDALLDAMTDFRIPVPGRKAIPTQPGTLGTATAVFTALHSGTEPDR